VIPLHVKKPRVDEALSVLLAEDATHPSHREVPVQHVASSRDPTLAQLAVPVRELHVAEARGAPKKTQEAQGDGRTSECCGPRMLAAQNPIAVVPIGHWLQ